MVDLLEVPAVGTGLYVQREDGHGEEIVALARGAVKVRRGVAGGEIDQSQLRIHRRRLPDRCATVLPGIPVGRPGVMAEFARSGDRVEGPLEFAVGGIVGLDAPAHAHVAATESGDHHAVVVQRRADDAVALERVLGLDGPENLASALIQRDELCVQLPHVHLAIAKPYAAVHPAAADLYAGGIQL